MSNPYFRFKQFTIFHDRSAMKVGTDGVLLGAWADTTGVQQILDIGTGTGLIALMLAQRTERAHIDAVEIDEDACLQARENVGRSPWSERIIVYHCSVQEYTRDCPKRYELVVSNPPFFENASPARDRARTLARHSDRLRQVDILQVAEQLLDSSGRLAAIYPPNEAKMFQEKAEAFGFYCNRKLCVKPTLDSQPKRILMELSKSKSQCQERAIALRAGFANAIESAKHIYTPDFIALIKDFYLKY